MFGLILLYKNLYILILFYLMIKIYYVYIEYLYLQYYSYKFKSIIYHDDIMNLSFMVLIY